MPMVVFRDVATDTEVPIHLTQDTTLLEGLEHALLAFPVEYPADQCQTLVRDSLVDPRKRARNLRLREGDEVKVVLTPAAMNPIDRLAAELAGSKPSQMIVFMGAGLSSAGSDLQLSTEEIHYGFLEQLASADPRKLEEKRNDVQELLTALSERKGPLDMLNFMKLFGSVEDLKERFLAHVIRTCCAARPNPGHIALLDLVDILFLKFPKVSVTIYTTNYDNLLEKARLDLGAWDVLPEYLTPRQYRGGRARRLRSRFLPVLSLHGSVRVSECPGCRRVLQTQAAALGLRVCVYCGTELPDIILPMAEGDVDRRALLALESDVHEADLVLFVGYGFNDPHIRDSIARNLKRSTRVANPSRASLPSALSHAVDKTFGDSRDLLFSLGLLATLLNAKRLKELQQTRRRRLAVRRGRLLRGGRVTNPRSYVLHDQAETVGIQRRFKAE